MSQSRSFLLMIFTAGLTLLAPVSASAQAPAVDRVQTTNLRPGEPGAATAFGKGLKEILYLWTPVGNLPFKPAEGKPNETTAQFEGTLPKDTVPGVYESRVVAARGVSARQFLVVDDLPSFTLPDASEVNPPKTKLPLTSCVNGQINAIKPKFFGLELKKDQSVSIEVFARRLDSPLDPVLRFLNAEGIELAFADDTPGLAGDVQLRVTAPEDGVYTLELRDVKYTGGAGHFFHLRIGDFPLLPGVFPGQTADGKAVTSLVDDNQSAAVRKIGPHLTSPVALVTDRGSSFASAIVANSAPAVEREPNNTRETATAVEDNATAIAGRLQDQNDSDWFKIKMTAAAHLCVTAHTRDFGSPADVVLKLYDSSGKKLQESDDVGINDAQLSLKLPAAGDYFVGVNELSGNGGPAWKYDLEIDRSGRIEVTTAVDTVAIPKEGTVVVKVDVKRLGISGPVEIVATNLPKGIVSTPVIVSGKQKAAIIALTSTSDAPDTLQHRILLEAKRPDDKPPIPVLYKSPTPKDKKPDHHLPRVQTGTFAVATAAAQFSLSPDPAEITITKGGEAKLTITAARTDKWTEVIAVASAIPAAELPVGVTISAAKIEKDSVEITIKADDKSKPGRYSISLQGTLKKDKTTITQPVPTITINISEASP